MTSAFTLFVVILNGFIKRVLFFVSNRCIVKHGFDDNVTDIVSPLNEIGNRLDQMYVWALLISCFIISQSPFFSPILLFPI